jgi:uncharacterized protein YneF (UPF0154 family)
MNALSSTGDAIGVIVALVIWGCILAFICLGVYITLERRNRRR